MMHANIANFVRQEVRVSKRKPLLPVFEAVSNALDAIADRTETGTIRVTVLREHGLIDAGRGDPHTFIIEDDGIGFNKDNMRSFDELYSERRIQQGGKGRGRFAFLKVFGRVEIVSTFEDAGAKKERKFTFDTNYLGHDENKEPPASSADTGTKITLAQMRQEYATHVPKTAESLSREFISHFLPMLLSERPVEIIIDDDEEIRLTNLVRNDLLIEKNRTEFTVGSRNFFLLSVKLRPRIHSLRHRIILAAALREVSGHNLDRLIAVLTPSPLELPGEPEGFYFVSIIQGDFLDQTVDPMRVGFTDEDDEEASENDEAPADEPLIPRVDLFGEPQSIGEIRREALKIIRQQLAAYIEAAVAHRSQAIESYISRDGMGYHFIKAEIPEIAKNLRATDDRTIETTYTQPPIWSDLGAVRRPANY